MHIAAQLLLIVCTPQGRPQPIAQPTAQDQQRMHQIGDMRPSLGDAAANGKKACDCMTQPNHL